MTTKQNNIWHTHMVEVDFIWSELIYLFKTRNFDTGLLTLKTAKYILMLLIKTGGNKEHVMIYVLIYECILRNRLCMILIFQYKCWYLFGI